VAELIEHARARRDELRRIIDSATAEWQELNDFLQHAEKVEKRLTSRIAVTPAPAFIGMHGGRPETSIQRPEITKRESQNTTELIDFVMSIHGPRMHVKDILVKLIDEGWHATGNSRKDYKNVYAAVLAKPDRFKNLGKAVFERIGEPKAARH